MKTMKPASSGGLVDRLDAATASGENVEVLARSVFEAVAVDVPFEFGCLATTDPASGLITGAYKSAPLPMGDEDFAAAEYGGPDINQLPELASRPVPVGVLSVDTDGEPQRCRRMRDYMGPVFGFSDELRLCCRAGGATWGALGLYRGTFQPPFTRADGQVLAATGELIADRLRRCLFADSSPTRDAPGAAVLIVDAASKVTNMTAAAEAHIDDLGGWDHAELPTNILAVASLARSSNQPATTQVLARSGRWLTLRAMPLGAGESLVVSIDIAAQAAIGKMRLGAQGLTAREQDVAQLVLQGASTKDIAASLFLSPHTVQDHLKVIFRKLEVNSRREMIAQLVL